MKGKTCSEISKGSWIGEKDKNTCPTGYKPEVVESTIGATAFSDGPCYKCTIGNCFGKESKIYYVTYGQYLQGNVAYQSACQCSSYLVKGNSPNITPLKPGGPIKINAISTPGGGSSSTEKIKLPTILTGVSSSIPYSVKFHENCCLGDDHCSAQAVKFDVFEKYAPDTAKSLKEDDYFFDGVGVATTFEEGYFYTGRQLKPKSQSINTCDDYVVILGNGNPKACAQISSDYYNYHESCPKGLEKKRLPNVYDSTGAQCYKCEKVQTCSEISNGSWKGENDKNTCPTGYKPEVVESTIGATAFSDGPCYKCEYDGKSCSQLYEGSSYSDKCSTNEIATTVGKDEAGKNCYTCSKCYKESSSGTVANKSTIYYYRADEPYKNGECASEMTINVVCDNTNLKAKLYVNGKETQANPNSYQNTEGKWFGDFMNCTGCATVECTFKYGDKTKITIPQTGGPGD